MVDATDWYDDFISEENKDEKIVELTEIADEKKVSSTKEDIIDLTEIVDGGKILSTQEDIIDLTDIADKEKAPSTQEDIIELTDIIGDDTAILDMESRKAEGFKSEENLELENDISFTEGTELTMEDPVNGEPSESDVVAAPGMQFSVPQEQLEAALERVIEKKFADKIEFLLLEGMEKAIKKEIIEIKERLQKDLDQLEIV